MPEAYARGVTTEDATRQGFEAMKSALKARAEKT